MYKITITQSYLQYILCILNSVMITSDKRSELYRFFKGQEAKNPFKKDKYENIIEKIKDKIPEEINNDENLYKFIDLLIANCDNDLKTFQELLHPRITAAKIKDCITDNELLFTRHDILERDSLNDYIQEQL